MIPRHISADSGMFAHEHKARSQSPWPAQYKKANKGSHGGDISGCSAAGDHFPCCSNVRKTYSNRLHEAPGLYSSLRLGASYDWNRYGRTMAIFRYLSRVRHTQPTTHELHRTFSGTPSTRTR